MALDFLNAFGLPLLSKSLLLRSVAHRAITLAAPVSIQWMALTAVRLLGIDVADAGRISLRVVAWRQRVEVLRIHAMSVTTRVIHHVAFRDRPIGQPERDAVSLSGRSSEIDDAIAVAIQLPSPENAISRTNTFGLEACPLHFGGVWGLSNGCECRHGC